MERIQTLNTYRLDWTATRRRGINRMINAADASVVCVQECTPEMRTDIMADTGLTAAHAAGNLAVLIKAKTWTVEHDNDIVLRTGADNRRAVAVVLKHRETGREVKVVNTHLTNLEGGGAAGEGWRLGQAAEILEAFTGIDVLTGDFNSRRAVYSFLAGEGLYDMRERAVVEDESTGHNWIDNVLTRESIDVLAGGVIPADGTDHPSMWIRIGVEA